jgi:hypothetical protein
VRLPHQARLESIIPYIAHFVPTRAPAFAPCSFNLNINIVAPECLVPNVGYIQKWAAFEFIPFGVAVAFLLVHGALVLWKRVLRGQRKWEIVNSHLDTMISAYLIMFFFLFLQLFRMQVCETAEREGGMWRHLSAPRHAAPPPFPPSLFFSAACRLQLRPAQPPRRQPVPARRL